jgi:hypothetical protein
MVFIGGGTLCYIVGYAFSWGFSVFRTAANLTLD